MSLSLQCTECLVQLTWMVCEMGGTVTILWGVASRISSKQYVGFLRGFLIINSSPHLFYGCVDIAFSR